MNILKAIILLAVLLSAAQISAQTTIQPTDATISYDNGNRPCIQVNLDPEPKTLKKAWRDYLKKNYDFKLKGIGFLSNKDLLSAEEIMIPQLSSKQMDFFTFITEDENGSEMKIFIRYGYDIFLTKEKTPLEYEKLSTLVNHFLKQYLPKYYNNRINDTEERIEKLSDEKEDLQKDIIRDSSKIADLKKEIEDLESALKINNGHLEMADKKLIKRSEKLERIRKQLQTL